MASFTPVLNHLCYLQYVKICMLISLKGDTALLLSEPLFRTTAFWFLLIDVTAFLSLMARLEGSAFALEMVIDTFNLNCSSWLILLL